MVNGIVLPIKKVFALVDSKISVEIKDEKRKLQGRLVAVDEYLNIHMDETIEFINNERGRSLGTRVFKRANILMLAIAASKNKAYYGQYASNSQIKNSRYSKLL